MAPIPINSDKPISSTAAQKPTGTTPHTAIDTSDPSQSAPVPSSASSRYAPAQPAAPPVPAPTGAIYTRFPPSVPPPPTRTTNLPTPQSDDPPPPQPGAVPQPPTTAIAQQQPTESVPPPPTSGYAPQLPQTTYPPQMSIPPPASNAAPTKSTTTASYAPPTQSFIIDSTTAPTPTQTDLSHPPGYTQDPQASEMSAAQRAVQEQQAAADSPFAGLGMPTSNDSNVSGAGTSGSGNVGLLDSFRGVGSHSRGPSSGEGGVGELAGSAWNAVSGFVGTVATKAEELENAVWRRVNEGNK